MNNRNRDPLLFVPQILLWTLLLLAVSLSPLRGQDGIEVPKTTHDPSLYLFVDDHWIADQQGLTRIHNRAQPLEKPIIWPDDPKAETGCAWGNVVRKPDGRFRMWYVTMTMKKMVTSDEYRHVPTGTLALLAQRLGKVVASSCTWYRLIRIHDWRRPRKRIHPAKPKVGIRQCLLPAPTALRKVTIKA